MTPSLLRLFRPLFETASILSQGRMQAETADLRPLRADLVQRLLALKQALAARASERDSYLMLFALVVQFDELVRTTFPEADHATWPLLQRELFDTDRGGELFYQLLVELLDTTKAATPVHEVYLCCLDLGFRGKYAQDPESRAQLMQRLRVLLAATPAFTVEPEPDEERPSVAPLPRLRSPAWPYALAAAAVVALYMSLASLATTVGAHWQAAEASTAAVALGRQATIMVPSDSAARD